MAATTMTPEETRTEAWIERLSEHFGKMVSAATGNCHPVEQRQLMREWVRLYDKGPFEE